jgi:D-3-phosphoglycerate dehydrogenase
VAAGDVPENLRPFLPLAETIGRMFTALAGALPPTLEISYEGAIAEEDTRILRLSVLRGLFADVVLEPVTLVNAPLLAQERGVEVRETSVSQGADYVNLIRLAGHPDGRATSLAATLVGRNEKPKIVEIDGHDLECPPATNMLIVHNDDRPGMIGLVGTLLGQNGVNISDMAVGVHPEGHHAVMAITTSQPTPETVLDTLRGSGGILEVRTISLG